MAQVALVAQVQSLPLELLQAPGTAKKKKKKLNVFIQVSVLQMPTSRMFLVLIIHCVENLQRTSVSLSQRSPRG